jgi:putative permease
MTASSESLYKTLRKAIVFAATMIALLWLLYKTAGVLLLILFAFILALVINTPVGMLEKRGIKRGWACAIVFSVIFLVIGLMGWLVIPIISKQVSLLINNLPAYATNVTNNIASWFKNYPEIYKDIQENGIAVSQWMPSVPKTLASIGNYSVSIISFILFTIFFTSMVIYAVANPRPLLQTYFSMFNESRQQKATEALIQTSVMLTGWFKANIIGGTIRAVCVTLFLTFMGVPAAMVWGVLTFFSELVPKLGFYIMAIPILLVSLSVGPYTALWVLVFLIVLDEIMGDIVLPKLRSRTMNLHPVSTFFVLLVMASAFGVWGVLLATPITAIIKAYYEVFFDEHSRNLKKKNEQVEAVLYREKPEKMPVTD